MNIIKTHLLLIIPLTIKSLLTY